MSTLRRCPACATFYPKPDPGCPECGTPAPAQNKALVMGRLNGALNAEAARATANA